jgi:hypothetical protein
MKLVSALCVLALAFSSAAVSAGDSKKPPAADPKKEDKDPLAKFSEDKLVDIGFCFEKFCEAVSAKDVKTVAAFVDDMPRGLKQLDLNKEADKAQFLRFFAKFEGAQIVSAQRMPAGGIGEVKFTDKSGKEQSQRMQKAGPLWKVTGL